MSSDFAFADEELRSYSEPARSMRFLPERGRDRLGLALFPFKAYLVFAPVCLIIWRTAVGDKYVGGALAQATIALLPGYLLCILIFFVVAVVQFVGRQHKEALQNILFAALAVIILLFLLPLCAT